MCRMGQRLPGVLCGDCSGIADGCVANGDTVLTEDTA